MTDMFMLNEYNNVFKHYYHTEGNKELFKNKLPDGWDIIDDTMFIIEDKRIKHYKNEGKKQLIRYYAKLPEKIKQNNKIFLVLGYGVNLTEFKYVIYTISDNKLITTNETLNSIHDKMNHKKEIDINKIKEINTYIYDNINIPKSQKTLFIASILICLKLDPNFIENNKGKNITDEMIKTIENYYNDNKFTDMFSSMKRSINYKHYNHLFNILQSDINIYGKDILNTFYSEFCIWDKNGDAGNGVVLTPSDIVELMIKELNISPNDKVLDFCTGTGSFLMEASKYTKYLYGCENNVERYSLAKCNFILKDLDYTNLHYNSCFNEQYLSNEFDKVVINPPFSCNNTDEINNCNYLNWKDFKEEQKFVIYGIELLKLNGIGCFIIPCRNFRNSKANYKFKETILKNTKVLKIICCNNKVFVPNASVMCSILIVKRIKCDHEYSTEIIDYSDDGYEVLKKARIYKNKPNIKTQKKVLKINNNWNYENDVSTDNVDYITSIAKYNNDYNYYLNNLNIINKEFSKIRYKDYIIQEDIKPFTYIISELLTEIKGIKIITARNTKNGIYPLLSSSSVNNGVIKYIDTYSYDTNDEYIISIANSGSSGYAFVQRGKLSRTGHVDLYQINNKNINPHFLAMLITKILTRLFNYNHGATYDRIKDIEISYS